MPKARNSGDAKKEELPGTLRPIASVNASRFVDP
jgi:hypothetical protein